MKTMTYASTWVLFSGLLLAVGCETGKAPSDPTTTAHGAAHAEEPEHASTHQAGAEPAAEQAAVGFRAVAALHPTEGSSVAGLVAFEQTQEGVMVKAQITGLSPGDHGFHVHQWGDCTAPDGTSAGGHFNPMQMPHAGPDATTRHVGDLGNLTADESGTAVYERLDKHLSFVHGSSIVGRGLIVHEKSDDLTSQPTGAAGARVACGVIGVSAPAE